MWTRILSLIVKELLALTRDPRGRLVLVAPPLIQLFIFIFPTVFIMMLAPMMKSLVSGGLGF